MKSRVVILLFTIVSFFVISNTARNWNWWVFKWDKSGYHLYLPALLVYNDITKLEFYSYIDDAYRPSDGMRNYALTELENGNRVNKYAIGVAVRELPFFAATHFLNLHFIHDLPDGYCRPYQWGAIISNLFWTVMGLLILRSFLRRHFSDTVTAVTLLALGFGTNIYHYTVFSPCMAHNYLFFDFALVIFCTDRLYSRGTKKDFYLLGLALGFIGITRITDLVVVLIPLLWGLNSKVALRQRLTFLKGNMLQLAGGAFVFLCVMMLQMGYWKYVTGHWIYNGYVDEGFVWSEPAIWEGLFGFRKGWFIYTPLAVFAVWGIYSMRKRFSQHIPVIIIFMVVNIYIIFSWWNWWYGGSFGSRPMLESLAILSLPLAAFVEGIVPQARRSVQYSAGILLILLCALNMFQSYQSSKNVIHWDAMTRKYYFRTFLKLKPTEDDLRYLLTDDEKFDEVKRRVDKMKK